VCSGSHDSSLIYPTTGGRRTLTTMRLPKQVAPMADAAQISACLCMRERDIHVIGGYASSFVIHPLTIPPPKFTYLLGAELEL